MFVDFEQGLNFCIRRIRAALDDDPNSPKFLETVPRRGYRFISDVETVPPNDPERASPPAVSKIPAVRQPAPEATRFKGRLAWTVAALVLVTLSLLAIQWRHPEPKSFLSERRLTANPEETPVLAAAISPDGKYLAYADATGFYVKQVDSGETRRLGLPEGLAAIPDSWFPDSTDLIATSMAPGSEKTALWKISILGGNPQKLLDDGFGAEVSHDGRRIAFLRGGPDHGRFGHEVWLMNLSDRILFRLAGNTAPSVNSSEASRSNSELSWFTSAVWSPNGDQVAYTELSLTSSHAAIALKVQSANHPDAGHTLVSDLKLEPSICWSPDNRIVYSKRNDEGSINLNSGRFLLIQQRAL